MQAFVLQTSRQCRIEIKQRQCLAQADCPIVRAASDVPVVACNHPDLAIHICKHSINICIGSLRQHDITKVQWIGQH